MKLDVIIIWLMLSTLIIQIVPAYAQPSCAKDMFFDQLDSPTEKINTGLKYWIQLCRKGKISLVDNRTKFFSGDEIRFQVIPNINGYAYAVLVRGSTGQQKVLFPNAYEPKGRVTAGKQYLLPAKGFLQFDKNAGTESVRLVISRQPVSATALLDSSGPGLVRVASNASADNPIKNQNCVLAFGNAEGKGIELSTTEVKSSQPAPSNLSKDGQSSVYSKDLNYVPPSAISRVRRRSHKVHHVSAGKKTSVSAVIPPVERRGSVTVIDIEPTENLIADIQLTHL
jgi:hypothetical protein